MPNPVYGGYDPDAIFHFGRMSSTDTALKNAINDLIVWTKIDGTWSKIKAIVPVSDNGPDSLLDLKGTYDASLVNSPAFTVNRGFTINEAANAYINSNFLASNLSRTSHCLFVYVRTSLADFGYLAGAGSTANDSITLQNETSSGNVYFYGDVWGTTSETGLPAALGFIGGSRIGNDEILRINASEANFTLTSSLGDPLTSGNVFIGNFNGFSANPLDGAQIAAWGFAEGLTSSELSNLRDRIQAYMVARGAAV